MGITAGLVAVGSWVTAGAATGVVAGAIGGALVGAAIGGLTSAITGGNILQGVLFGAVGGAVSGGISSWAATPAVSGATSSASQALIAQEGVGWAPTVNAATSAVGTGIESTSSMLTSIGSKALEKGGGQVLGAIVEKGLGGYMASEAAKDQRAFQEEQATIAHERSLEKMRLASELSDSSGGGGDSGSSLAAQLNYNARMEELDQRKKEFDVQTEQMHKEWDTTQQRIKDRQAVIAGSGGRTNVDQGTQKDGTSIFDIRQGNVKVDQPVSPTTPEATTTDTQQDTALSGVPADTSTSDIQPYYRYTDEETQK